MIATIIAWYSQVVRVEDFGHAVEAITRNNLSISSGWGVPSCSRPTNRMVKIVPADHIFINTNEEYVELVREQLPQIPAEPIMAEPIHRNTAPSVAWANHRVSQLNPKACLITTPCD